MKIFSFYGRYVIFIFFLGILSCSNDDGAKNLTKAVPVKTEIVRKENFTSHIQAIGNVEASASVNLVPRVTGEIMAVHFQEGQQVEEGQILIQLDPRPFEAALAEKKANLARDEAQLVKALEDQRRYGKLLGSGYVSRESFEQAATNAATMKAAVQADRALMQSAALDLEYCFIKAPIKGRVGKLNVHKGNMVTANSTQAIARIDAISPAYVIFSISETYLPKIMANMKNASISITAQLPGGETEEGKLTLLDNSVDSATGTIQLRGIFANERQNLWPGQYTTVSVPLDVVDDALLVPTRSIQHGRNSSQIYIVDDQGKAQLVKVKPLYEDKERTVVEGEIQPGQHVVVEGQVRLAPGMPVKQIN